MQPFNISEYIAHLSIDCVIFGYQENELKVLISQFKYGANLWGLPGGYIKKVESIEAAAERILKERTNLDDIYLEQFRVFGGENRILKSDFKDQIKNGLHKFAPQYYSNEVLEWMTDRFVCIGFYALVDLEKVTPQNGFFEDCLEWRNFKELPKMTHDHNIIVSQALEALRKDLDEKLIAFNLLPETFIMKDVKQLYEAVYNKSFPMNNFQKKILSMNVLERLGKQFSGAQNRAPYMYKVK